MKLQLPGISIVYLYQYKCKNKPHASGYSFHKISPESDNEIKEAYKFYSEELCRKRWLHNSELSCFKNERNIPCSFAWTKIGKKHFIGELNKNLSFKKQNLCIYDCITPITFRGLGYYSGLINHLSNLSQNPVFIYALASNKASNKGIKKAGFLLTHKMLRIFGWVFVFKILDLSNKFYVEKRD